MGDEDPNAVDAAAEADSAPQPDAPVGVPDASSPADAASTPDANPPPPDAAAVPDATPSIDAPIDAGVPDAAPPDANNCPASPCDLVQQCGCTPPLACDLNAGDPLGGNECRAVNATGTEADECADFDECAGGFVCVGAGSGTDASCKSYCASDADCDSPRGQCLIQLSVGGTDIPGAVVCSSNCDPTSGAPSDCPATWGCFLFTIDPDGQSGSGDEIDLVDCAPAGAGVQSSSCAGDEDCAPGFLCLDAGGATPECLRICNNVGSACAADPLLDCLGFTDPHEVGGVEFGVCF